MATVGVRDLKNHLTSYLRRTAGGEHVIVTERGRPVAVLRAISAGPRDATRDERLARLASQGYLTLPTDRPGRFARSRVIGVPLSETVLEGRR